MSQETRVMGLTRSQKSFKIALAVLIQYWRVTDRHPATQPRRRSIYCAYYVARLRTGTKLQMGFLLRTFSRERRRLHKPQQH